MRTKGYYAFFSLLVILAFMAYIVYDSVRPVKDPLPPSVRVSESNIYEDKWHIKHEVFIREGLKAVAVSDAEDIFLGGESFIACYDKDLKKKWEITPPSQITALASYGDTLYATSPELIFLIDSEGKIKGEWGPYDDNCLITSVSANLNYVAVADASNKIVFIIRKDGEVSSMIGHFEEKLHIPSPYFDVALTGENRLFMANTGRYRIETRSLDGNLLSVFGVSGMNPDGFCGCCNPAHFAVIPEGFITAEKGINRIKILDYAGDFLELVSSRNNFTASMPLDVASVNGKTIYCANPADSKLYVFIRNVQ